MQSIYSRSIFLYNNAAQSIKTRVREKAIDAINLCLPLISGLVAGVVTKALSNNPYLIGAASLVCGAFSLKLCNKYFFKRSIEQEIERIVETSKGKEKKALIIHTLNDPNEAFGLHFVADIYRKYSRKFEVDRMRTFSFNEKQRIKGHSQHYYDIIHLMAHGSPKQIGVDGNDFFSSLNIFSNKKIQFLHFRIKEGGVIILDSCSTAKGENNIAQFLSKEIPHATVIASSADIYPFVGTEFDEDMIPRFNDGISSRGKDTTCVYRAGVLFKRRVNVPASSSS